MKYIYDTDTNNFIGPLQDIAKKSAAYEIPGDKILESLSSTQTIDTGIIPCTDSGLVSYRARAGYEQLVIQVAPGIYPIKWGKREHDANAPTYEFAMPYRIIIADFDNGSFLGLRHFFSVTPAYSEETPLYATPFANTNNLGYRQTSVGWTCLYHTRTTPFANLAEKIDYCVMRESGFSEPYNDVNMSSTDGPIFYQRHKATSPQFHSKEKWHAWTVKHGMEHVFDPSIYIQYMCDVSDQQYAQQHAPASHNAVHYTLRHAMYNNYAPYYGRTEVKPINGGSLSDRIASISGALLVNRQQMVTWSLNGDNAPRPVPAGFKQVKDKIVHLLDGKKCEFCATIRPYEESLYPYVSGWDDQIPVFSAACKACLNAYMTRLNYNGAHFMFSVSALNWSNAFECHLIPHQSLQCDNCGDAAPIGKELEFYVYTNDIDHHTYCTTCVVDEDEDYQLFDLVGLDARTGKMVITHYLTPAKALVPVPGTGSLAIGDVLVHKSFANGICKCGLYIANPESECLKEKNEDGTLTCVTCVTTSLINVDPMPVAINDKGQQ